MEPPPINPRSLFTRRLAAGAGAALVMLLGLVSIALRRGVGGGPATAAAPLAAAPALPAMVDAGREDAPARVIRAFTGPGADDSEGSESPIDASAVARIIRAELGSIRACYLRERRHIPTLAGRLDIRFTIGPRGRITSLSAGGPIAEASPSVGRCVGERLRSLRYPASEGGDQEFSFPFRFSPDP